MMLNMGIWFRPFPILGGATFAPPSTFSMGNRQNSLAHTLILTVLKLEHKGGGGGGGQKVPDKLL